VHPLDLLAIALVIAASIGAVVTAQHRDDAAAPGRAPAGETGATEPLA
jgi:hypothetical protein